MTVKTKDTLFKIKSTPAQKKAETTTAVARALSDAETSVRQAKTARLKALRLAKERKDAVAAAKAPIASKRRAPAKSAKAAAPSAAKKRAPAKKAKPAPAGK